jgi:hypothetical protein
MELKCATMKCSENHKISLKFNKQYRTAFWNNGKRVGCVSTGLTKSEHFIKISASTQFISLVFGFTSKYFSFYFVVKFLNSYFGERCGEVG